MSRPLTDSWAAKRAAKGELVGGGFFVFRRGKRTGRVAIALANHLPFEHASRESAEAEASRLAGLTPGERFVVLEAVATVGPVGTDGEA